MTGDLETELGLAAALGFDATRFLRADPVERPILVAALAHAARFRRERDEALVKALAQAVVAEISRAMKRGGRR